MKSHANLKSVVGLAAAIGILSLSATAGAWSMRVPGFMCVSPSTDGARLYFTPDAGAPSSSSEVLSISGSTLVLCPFYDAADFPDSDVATLTVDLQNPTGSTQSAGTLELQACTYTSWSNSCGMTTGNAAISAGSHDSLSLDLTTWTADTGNGYAYIYGTESSGNSNNIAGIYIAD